MAVPILLSPVGCVDTSTSNNSNTDATTTTTTIPSSRATTHGNLTSVVSNDGVFWISLGSDERYLLPKLDQLLLELEYDNVDIRSFRISNTQDISNLSTNRPLLKLKQIFQVLAQKKDDMDNPQQQQQQQQQQNHHHHRELFIKMSLQTESFQDLMHCALLSGAFSRLTVKGDYWTVAMEPKTIEYIAHAISKGRLEQLQLVGMFMGVEATTLLSKQLQQEDIDPTMALQSLFFCRINFEDMTPLLDTFKWSHEKSKNSGSHCDSLLQGLSVVECNFNDSTLVPLVEALLSRLDDTSSGNAVSLTRLSLAGNMAGKGTIRAIANYLQHPKCRLQHLNLSRQTTPNMATLMLDDSLSPFLASLSKNQSLCSLGLTHLSLEGHHIATLFGKGNQYRLPTTLTDLNLAHNLITSVWQVWGDGTALKSIPTNDNLHVLNLTGNPFWLQVQASSKQNHQNCQERRTLMNLVNQYPYLGYLGAEVDRGAEIESTAGFYGPSRFGTMLQYSLDMNRAGRHLFHGKKSVQASPLPFSLVPFVLERANISPLRGSVESSTSDSSNMEFLSNRVLMNANDRSCHNECCRKTTKSTVNIRTANALYGLVQEMVACQFSGRL
ncbi:hypothetical protein IV203_021393 [Nitzschia inconspicua]|uniref:Uncharacterized protein n=1 Tax=Nitzschia inconspicua TaxID=303405 RepID=A0A9K3KGS1_9STRA|nr:hypothetical protein IV203_021393 [Nitzschia inconspicua]